MPKIEFTIREPKIKWLNKIIFSLLFSIFFTSIFYLIKTKLLKASEESIPLIVFLLWLFGVLITFLVPIVSRHHIHFNFSELKIKHSYSIGAYHYYEKWQNLIDLKYISVFNNSGGYTANIWYKKNEQLNLFFMEDSIKIMEKALFFANQLHIDLLDARTRGHHKWVDKKATKSAKEILYED